MPETARCNVATLGRHDSNAQLDVQRRCFVLDFVVVVVVVVVIVGVAVVRVQVVKRKDPEMLRIAVENEQIVVAFAVAFVDVVVGKVVVASVAGY